MILSEDKYLETVNVHKNKVTFFPGKYTFNVLMQLQRELKRKYSINIGTEDNNDVEYFVNVLKSTKVDISKQKIVIFEISPQKRI